LDCCECSGIRHLDQLTGGDDLLPDVSFLRQCKTTRDTLFEPRYVYNIFQTCNIFLRANAILFAGEMLGQLDYEEKEVKPYKPNELKALFQAADDEEQLWMKAAGGWTANTEQPAWPSKTSAFIHCVAMCNKNFAATLLILRIGHRNWAAVAKASSGVP
jgi:hypothetical protein